MPEDVQSYWRSVLERVDKPNARRLLSDLDLTTPLGIRQASQTKRQSQPPMYDFFLQTKIEHPYAVLLVRVRCQAWHHFIFCELTTILSPWLCCWPRCSKGHSVLCHH